MSHTLTLLPDTNATESAASHMVFSPNALAEANAKYLALNLGTFRRPTAKTAELLREIGYYDLPKEVFTHMRTRKPEIPAELWGRIEPIVEDAVALTGPQLPYAAQTIQTTVAKYLAWVMLVKHLPLDAQLIWSRQLIDLYVTDAHSHLAEGTRRNYRSYLDRVSRILCPEEHPYEYTPQNRKSTVAPYLPAEIDQFKRWAANQSVPAKRRRAVAMLTLCAGAGLTSSEVGLVCPEHIEMTPHGIIIQVEGKNRRRVPLQRSWDEWAHTLLDGATPAQPIWGQTFRADKTSLLSSFVENSEGKGPNGQRLRNTWLVWHLNNRTPMKDLFYAAGFRKMEHLPRLLEHCDFLPDDQFVQILRGEHSK